MKTSVKRLIAVFLSVMMMVTALPLTAFPVSAASDFSITSPSDDYTFDYEKMLTIKWTSYSGADHYWLTVKNMDTGETEYNRAVNSTSYSLYVGDFGTEYKIYAAAMDANDNVLNGGSAWDVIYVYTKDDDTFDVSEDYFEFEADGGSDTVCVYASSSYTLSESLSWITLSSTSGSSDKWITITCKANSSTSDREGTITVTHKSSGDKLYIDVYQEGQIPEIDVSEDYLEFSADGGTDTFKVYAEDAYTISESFSWISLSSTSGSSDKTITVTCSKNTSASSREGTITVKQTSTGEKFTIDVYQEGVTVQKKAPNIELTVSDTEIELGESFTYSGTAYGNDYKLNTVTVGISYFTSESNYENNKGNSVYLRTPNLSTSSKSVERTVYTGSGKYITGTNNTGLESFTLYFDKVGIYTVTLHGYSEEYGTDVYKTVRIDVVAPAAPEILDIDVSSDPVSVGEEFTITVKTNSSANGVIIYCDNDTWRIGKQTDKSSSNIYTFTYTFEKTNKTDADGYDVTNTRKILAYPYDSAGNIVTDSESMGDYNITVNPAEYEFPNFDIEAAVTTIGNSATIKWDALTTENGATVYYNLWIDNEVVAEDLKTNSYVLSATQVEKLGVGAYGIMVMATAKQYRMRQSTGGLTIEPKPNVKVYPGDVNGDGTIDGTDVTKLKKYLANYDETDPAKQSVVDPVGADVNGDSKINGKDLNALFVKLENGNIELPKPDPEPDIPSTLPAVKHTYTVKIPLDKADLKATTGRTIYLMPKYGYVKLVAYDETGKEVKLNQAGITVDISNANGVVTFDGFTLKAVKGGYGVISFTQAVNGKKTTTEIAIHVGEASASSSKWPSSYQYTKEDYEYVSMCLDLTYSIYKAQTPAQYVDIWMSDFDIVVDSVNSLDDYLLWILQGKLDFDAQIIKKSLSDFIVDYADEIAPEEDLTEQSIDQAENLLSFVKEIYSVYSKTGSAIGGADDIINTIVEIQKNGANKKRIVELAQKLADMEKNGSLEELYKNLDYITAWANYDELVDAVSNFKLFAVSGVGDKILDNLDWSTGISLGLNVLEGVLYVANDYSNSLKILQKLRTELLIYYDEDDVEIKAINDLITEFDNKYWTAAKDLCGKILVEGINIVASNPIFSILQFASFIAGEYRNVEERKAAMTLEFYSSALYKSLNATWQMYSNGKHLKNLDEMRFFTAIYLNLVLKQNELALVVTKGTNNETIVQGKIDTIKNMFADYLSYKFPAASN